MPEVVIGGPPCQGFSLLNKKRHGDARRELWKAYMQVVQQAEATVFLMENVEGLLKSHEFEDIQTVAVDMASKSPQVSSMQLIMGHHRSGDEPLSADGKVNGPQFFLLLPLMPPPMPSTVCRAGKPCVMP